MNEECGDGLKGFQLFSFHDLFGEPKVQQTHCHLIAHAFQQIQFFNRVGSPPTRSARTTTPMQRSPPTSGTQIRLPPVRNWLELIRLKLSAKSPFAFSRSKGFESLINSPELAPFPQRVRERAGACVLIRGGAADQPLLFIK